MPQPLPTVIADFEAALPDDADALAEMSRDIWRRHYLPGILSEAELNFFWDRAYRPAQLIRHMQAGGRYEWITVDKEKVGFLAYAVEADEARLHLSKLYLLPEFHGRGIGRQALRRVQDFARRLGVREIYLYVFRGNEQAIRAYSRAGFVISRTEITECGNGFRYDDSLMVYDLTADAAGDGGAAGGLDGSCPSRRARERS
jgi:RimJ/RimL family protein N-acetyltransferase